jgi:hypothetical protein
MEKTQVNYAICEDWRIPSEHLEGYAANIAFSKGYGGEIPAPPKKYFVERLTGLHEQPRPAQTTAYNIMPFVDEMMVGWGHLSWSGEKKDKDAICGEIYLYLIPKCRRQGLGKEMCHLLLERLPSHIGTLEIPAPEQAGAAFALEYLGAEIARQEERTLALLSRHNLENIRQQGNQFTNLAKESGFEVLFITDQTLEEKLGLPDFVRLVEETKDQPLSEDDLSAKIEAFQAVQQRDTSRGAQYWIYVLKDQDSGALVGYTHTILTAEGNQGTALDLESGLLPAYRSADLSLALKYPLLQRLLEETPATHWLALSSAATPYTRQADIQLGFQHFTTHTTFHLTKSERERFLQRQTESRV